MIKILFVCMGNICRSPAAEGVLRSKLERLGQKENKDFVIDSAGTIAVWEGSSPDKRSQAVMKKHDINISEQVSRPLRKDDGENFDMIICMDSTNVTDAKRIIDASNHHKVRLLDTHEVEDPYYRNDGFDRMYQHIDSATDALIKEIVKTPE